MVEFSRPSIDAEGRTDVASFRLAFASEGSPGAFVFTCERRKVPAIDRSTLERHANTVTRIARIDAVSDDPDTFARFLRMVADAGEVAGREVVLEDTVLRIAGDSSVSGARFAGVTFGVRDLSATAALFNANGIDYETRANTLRVPAAPGQGVDFIFEEI